MKLAKSIVPLMLAAVLASGCTSTGGSYGAGEPDEGQLSAFSAIEHPSKWYRDLFDDAPASMQQEYSILVARSYIREQNYEKAALWLKFAKEHALTPLQESKVHLATAYLHYSRQMYQKALEELTLVRELSLSRLESANYYVIRGNTLRKLGNRVEAYRSYVALNQYISENDTATMTKNQQSIVTLLMEMTDGQLEAIRKSGFSELDQGYLDFAANRMAGAARMAELDEDWLEKYPDHPARVLIGTRIAAPGAGRSPVKFDSYADISHIAVIMPFSGKLATYGDAFRQGIVMAQREKGLTSSIRYYDSNSGDVTAVYNTAVEDGAGFVIGPLTKENVSKIMAAGVRVPTLAINTFDRFSTDNAYFYALTPEHEGAQAARKIRRDGRQLPLLLVPDTDKGTRIINGFVRKWAELTGSSGDVVVKRFRNKQDANLAIEQGMSYSGIDAVYICGSAIETSLIKTQIEGSFPGDRGYYITSNSNPGNLKASVTRKMTGMNLGDMPWLLEDYALKSDISDSLDSSNINVLTFFALGYDSVTLAPELSSMAGSHRSIDGLTGTITVSEDGKVLNDFSWVVIE